jgi:hypothetical protein
MWWHSDSKIHFFVKHKIHIYTEVTFELWPCIYGNCSFFSRTSTRHYKRDRAAGQQSLWKAVWKVLWLYKFRRRLFCSHFKLILNTVTKNFISLLCFHRMTELCNHSKRIDKTYLKNCPLPFLWLTLFTLQGITCFDCSPQQWHIPGLTHVNHRSCPLLAVYAYLSIYTQHSFPYTLMVSSYFSA